MDTWIYFGEGKAAKGEEMGAAFHMPCPLKQWFSTCHCPYDLSRLWDPLPFTLPKVHPIQSVYAGAAHQYR